MSGDEIVHMNNDYQDERQRERMKKPPEVLTYIDSLEKGMKNQHKILRTGLIS